MPPPPRTLKLTNLIHEGEVAELFRSGTLKDSLKSLHTSAVKNTLESYPPNKVLLSNPPDINKEEQSLSRKARTGLTRLRSGYCRTLNSYMSRIKEEVQDVCPRCDASPHNTLHLFNCLANPTVLDVTSLWTHPREAAIFLQLEPGAAQEPPEEPDGLNE